MSAPQGPNSSSPLAPTVLAKSSRERRVFDRRTIVRPCKVRDRRMLLFSAGETCDVSEGGMMVRVDRARLFAKGDELDVVVAWGNDPLLSGEAMTRAKVLRVTPIDYHHQAVALVFDQPNHLAITTQLAA